MLLLVSGFLRGGWAAWIAHSHPERLRSTDTSSYVEPARALRDRAQFDQSVESHEAEFVRTPGYPAFLAILSILVGSSETSLAIGQAVLSVAVIWLTFLLGREVFGGRVGIVAATVVALEPLQFWASGTLLTEMLFSFSLLVVAFVTTRCLRHHFASARWWASLGLAIAVATLIRPTTYYLPVIVVPAIILFGWRRRIAAKAIAHAVLAFIVPIVLLIGGWQIRNHERVGSWRYSGVEALSMYLYRAGGLEARSEGRSFIEVREERKVAFGPQRDGESQGAYYDRMYDEGIAQVRNDLKGDAVVAAKGLVSEISGVASTVFPYIGIRESPILLLAARISALTAWLVAVAGCWLGLRNRRTRGPTVAMLTITLFVLGISAGPEAYSRFRAPVTPFLCILCASAIVFLYERHLGLHTDSDA